MRKVLKNHFFLYNEQTISKENIVKKYLFILSLLCSMSFAYEDVGIRDNNVIVVLKDQSLKFVFKLNDVRALITDANNNHYVVLRDENKVVIPIDEQKNFDFIANKLIQQK